MNRPELCDMMLNCKIIVVNNSLNYCCLKKKITCAYSCIKNVF